MVELRDRRRRAQGRPGAAHQGARAPQAHRGERRLTAAEDALATIPDAAPADAILHLANALQDAIHGGLESADTMAEINQSLREMFASFVVRRVEGFGPFNGLLIEPFLRPGQIAPPADPDVGWDWPKLIGAEPPPLRWLGPARNLHDAQESWHPGRFRLPSCSSSTFALTAALSRSRRAVELLASFPLGLALGVLRAAAISASTSASGPRAMVPPASTSRHPRSPCSGRRLPPAAQRG